MKSKSLFLLTLFLSLTLFSCAVSDEEKTILTFGFTGNFERFPAEGGRAREVISEKLQEQGLLLDYTLSPISGGDYKSLLKQSLLTNTAPMAVSVYPDQWTDLAQHGLLLPLEPYLTDMPHYQALVNPKDLEQFSLNGHIYAFPQLYMEGPINGPHTQGWAIRKDWLRELNLDLPQDLEELEIILKAFTKSDPDGNGIDDTKGLSLDNSFSLLWGAHGLPFVNKNFGWIESSYGIQHMTTLPEAREILLLLNRWYEAGYIDLNLNQKRPYTLLLEEKTGIVVTNVWELKDGRSSLIKNGAEDPLQMMPPVRGPLGHSGYPVLNVQGRALALSSTMTKKEIGKMISFLDWIVNTDEDGGFMTITYGVENDHYSVSEENDKIFSVDYNRLFIEGFSNPIRFIPIIDRRWVNTLAQKEDLIILNQEGNVLPYERVITFSNDKETHFYTDYLWPQISRGVIMGELDISTWEDYAHSFSQFTFDQVE